MKTALQTFVGTLLGLVIFFGAQSIIQAREKAIDDLAGCQRWPEPNERLVAYGSADGKPTCAYYKQLGYGMARQ